MKASNLIRLSVGVGVSVALIACVVQPVEYQRASAPVEYQRAPPQGDYYQQAPGAEVADEAPPPIPVYEQPPPPEEGYLWTPGYWGRGPGGYFWVPGTWVQPPRVGLLWTPGFWALSFFLTLSSARIKAARSSCMASPQ